MTSLALLIGGSLMASLSAAAPLSHSELDSLPSRSNFVFRIYEDDIWKSVVNFDFNTPVETRYRDDPTIGVEIRRVYELPNLDENSFLTPVSPGKNLRIEKLPRPSPLPRAPYVPFTINHDSWDTIQQRYRVEYEGNLTKREVLETVLKSFVKDKNVEEFNLFSSNSDWSEVIFNTLAEMPIKIQRCQIGFGERLPTEALILKFIQGTGVLHWKLVDDSQTIFISDAFFRDTAVKKMNMIVFFNGRSDITDETLAGLKAWAVTVGKASKLTAHGLRQFFQPVFDRTMETKSIGLQPSFKPDEHILDGLTYKLGSRHNLGARWTIKADDEKSKKNIVLDISDRDGHFDIYATHE